MGPTCRNGEEEARKRKRNAGHFGSEYGGFGVSLRTRDAVWWQVAEGATAMGCGSQVALDLTWTELSRWVG